MKTERVEEAVAPLIGSQDVVLTAKLAVLR